MSVPTNANANAEGAEADVAIATEPLAANLPGVADWIPAPLEPYWALVADTPPIAGLVVAVVFLVLAVVIRLALVRGLGALVGRTRSGIDDRVLADLRKPVFTTVAYLGLTLAVRTAELPFGTHLLVAILLSVIVVSWMRAALRISSHLIDGFQSQAAVQWVEPRTVPIIDLTVKLLTILVGSYALLLVWGINPVGWLASAGIVGIAVGFAAKDTLANLFSGFFIVADAPYKIGDYINLDSGERGQVSAIGLRSTRLLTRDDVEITIPNGVIANAKIVNESGGPYVKIRNRIAVGAAYGSDVDEVCAVLERVGRGHADTCDDPAPRVRMRGFGASSLDFELLVWIEHPEDLGRISHELYVAIYKAFDEAGIEIPYSKHDVYIKESVPPA